MSDLIERLRSQAAYDKARYPSANPLWIEAADEIERLRALNEELQGLLLTHEICARTQPPTDRKEA